MEEEDRKAAMMLQAQLETEAKADSQYRQLLEQERRDHELALRLAQESNGQIDESPTLSRKYVNFSIILFYFSLAKIRTLYKFGLVGNKTYKTSKHHMCVKYE